MMYEIYTGSVHFNVYEDTERQLWHHWCEIWRKAKRNEYFDRGGMVKYNLECPKDDDQHSANHWVRVSS